MAVFFYLLGICLGVELLGHMENSLVNILQYAKLCSKVAASFYIPTSNVHRFQFLHILTNICYYLSYRCEVVFHCGFDLHFPEG